MKTIVFTILCFGCAVSALANPSFNIMENRIELSGYLQQRTPVHSMLQAIQRNTLFAMGGTTFNSDELDAGNLHTRLFAPRDWFLAPSQIGLGRSRMRGYLFTDCEMVDEYCRNPSKNCFIRDWLRRRAIGERCSWKFTFPTDCPPPANGGIVPVPGAVLLAALGIGAVAIQRQRLR